MSTVFELEAVTVRRGTKAILEDASWTVQENERWVVLGRNGAGKTTILQVIGAQLHPTSGVAKILDEQIGKVDIFDLRPRIGFSSAAVAQRIPRNETVRDVVVTAAYAVTGRWNEEYDEFDLGRANDLLDLFAIEHLADRTYGTLSSGERKRVEVARALMTDPELLLLDEPSAGLDLGGREELLAALSEIARDPRSPAQVLVTHHVEEIPEGFTHLLLLKDARVFAAGPIDEVLTSANLSATFGLPIDVVKSGNRWTARGAQ